jgi:hypothetical protein
MDTSSTVVKDQRHGRSVFLYGHIVRSDNEWYTAQLLGIRPVASKVAPPNKALSMRVKELREERGWSQRVMADLMGIKIT